MKRLIAIGLTVVMAGVLCSHSLGADTPDYHIANPVLLPRTLDLIQQNYVDPKREQPQPMLKAALDQIQKLVPEIIAPCTDSDCTVTVGQASKKFAIGGIQNLNEMEKVLESIFAFIELHYHGKTKLKEIEYAAIDGLLNNLDPHSNLLTPKIYNEFKIGTKGNFGGIGIVIGSKDGELIVISPLEGTPAFRAGLKAKDRIVQIGDDSTINMSLTEAVEKLRGAVGTPVTVTIERPNRGAWTVTMKRAIIKIDSVQSTLVSVDKKEIGYLKIKSFQENTDRDMVQNLEALQKKAGRPLDGLILDMRNNPGGLLNQAIDVADYFMKAGTIVSTVGIDNQKIEENSAINSGAEPNYPMVVLINEGSASASEIVAGALQANHRAEVIGSQSFGKGSVQTIFDLKQDSALKLTIAEYLTAGKFSIQSVGVTPDVTLIPMTPDKKGMDLIENQYSGEKDLEKPLDRPIPSHDRATVKLAYFDPEQIDNSEDDVANSKEYTSTLNLKNDFAVSLASQMLTQMHGPNTSNAFAKYDPILKTERIEQQQKLASALQQLGIDWSTGPANGKQLIQLSSELQYKGQVVSSLRAGEEGHLILKAKNTGTGTYYQLIGYTKLDELLFANKEFVFGKLAPGTERSWSVPIKLPKAAPALTLGLKVVFNEANGNAPTPYRFLVPVSAQPRPQFAFRFTLELSTSKTPDLEPLPKGKIIPLTVTVKNLGPGTSQDTIASIKNADEKGAFIQVGRVKLGKLAPNQTATANFKFRIDETYDASTLKLDLSITDINILENITHPIVFTLGSGATDPAAGPWYQGPKISMNGIKVPIVTTSATQVIQGLISDDQSVKDCLIFVGDEKVLYQTNAGGGNSFNFKATLPLKPGNNFVTIASRDNNDLMTRYTFTILRNVDKLPWHTKYLN